MLRIALIQQRCEKAAIAENLDALSGYLAEASRRDVDIVGFPEMNITGYADPTRFPRALLNLDGPEVSGFLQRTETFPGTVLAGLIEANPSGKPFITQIAARRGTLEGFYRKVTIQDEEAAWFSPGDRVPVFQHDGLTFGIAICADLENPRVFADCRQQGARFVFELAAPGLYGSQETRDWRKGFDWWEGDCQDHLGRYASEHSLWIGAATQAGRTIDEDFPGGGFLFDPHGRRVYATKDGSPCAVFLEIDMDAETVREIV